MGIKQTILYLDLYQKKKISNILNATGCYQYDSMLLSIIKTLNFSMVPQSLVWLAYNTTWPYILE